MADYTYTISVDFAGGYNGSALYQELVDASVTGLTEVRSDADADEVVIVADVSQTTAINAVVASHTGAALPRLQAESANLLTFNKGTTGSPTTDAEIQVDRGVAANARSRWDETAQSWKVGTVGNEKVVAVTDDVPDALEDLTNVRNPMTPADGESLTWNNGNSECENQDVRPNATNVNAAGAVMESDYNAQTLLIATADNTPQPVLVDASRFVGRKATGDLGAMSPAEARTELNVEDGATADQTGAEIKSAYEGEFSDSEGAKRGTYVVAFGPQMDRLDAEAVRRLRDARPRNAKTGGAS